MLGRKQKHFEISERRVLLRFFDLAFVWFTLAVVGILFRLDYFRINTEFWEWGVVLGIYLSVFASIFELYDLQKANNIYLVFKNSVFTTSATVLFFLLTPYFTPELPTNRLQIVYFYLAILLALLLWRMAYIALISSPRFYKKVALFGDPGYMGKYMVHLQKADPNYNIIGAFVRQNNEILSTAPTTVNLIEVSENGLAKAIKEHQIDEVLISNLPANGQLVEAQAEIIALLKSGFPIKDFNKVYEEKTFKIPVQHMEKDFYKFFPFSRNHQNKLYLFFQRLMDILISAVGIIIGILLVPFILIGNIFGNRGSLFYYQDRVGKNGENFTIFKFRSMKWDAEWNGAQWAQKNDLRATPFGKFMRRSRIDELPQFYNILKGEMSLIGPRPERPIFVTELSKRIHFYDTRHVIKPGLTGWAQVMNPYGNSYDHSLEKLQYDLYYIKHRNFFLDFTILIKTMSTVLFYRGQ